jgi:hypothetical protein
MRAETKTIEISRELKAEIEGLKRKSCRAGSIKWTKEMDDAILFGWEMSDQEDFVRWFKEKFGRGAVCTISRRYKSLIGG